MPNLKISELPSGNPAVSTDQIPIARSGANYQITLGSMGSAITNLAAWQSVQTINFTAVAGKGYPVNTTSGQVTVTLPASPTVGDVIAFTDYAGTFGTNGLNINPNGNNINGSNDIYAATTNRTGLQLVYVDATQGWVCYGDTSSSLLVEQFTINGLVVAGGGGAAFQANTPSKGGSGAGGFRTYQAVYPSSPSPGTIETGTVTIGAGGAILANGNNSVLNTITSAGGGKGANNYYSGANSGGSGGGASNYAPGYPGAGNVPAVSPSQGNPGGIAPYPPTGGGGGAGGAGVGALGGLGAISTLLGAHSSSTSNTIATGSITFTIATSAGYSAGEPIRIYYDSSNFMDGNITSYNSGTGVLVLNSIRTSGSGTYTSWVVTRCYAGGGGSSGSAGGSGGGAPGGGSNTVNTSAVINSGGGAGGNNFNPAFPGGPAIGNGGSGVVLISVPNTGSVTFSAGVTSTMTTVGANKVYKVTATSTTSETYTVTVP